MTASLIASWRNCFRTNKEGLRRVSRWGAAAAMMVFLCGATAWAQTGGEAGITGTVTDATGAAIPHATVTATDNATGVATSRETSGTGLFTISPILPGTYTVRVKVAGFSEFVQKNFEIDALKLTPLNIAMKVGAADTTVEVTEAPPQLETTNATLGLTIESEAYANLPIATNSAMRDPTAFGNLAPGAQSGARLPIIGGTANYLGQLYLDGLPAETISQQGDNRLVSQAVSVDAVDQIQVVTSTPPAEYSGAGAENFSMKSGGLKYHGQVSDFIHNTALDAWPFLTKEQTVPNALGVQVPASKPVDHQNELSAILGGHVPGTKRVFFFVGYDRYHQRTVKGPASYNIPSTLMTQGDFTELNGNVGSGGFTGVSGDPSAGGKNPAFLYDPTTTNCSGGTCTRQPFVGMKGGFPTYNVIPASYISPQAQFFQKFMPAPTNPTTLTNNYTGSYPSGFDNWALDYRVDFDWTSRHRISAVGALGYVNYLNNVSAPYLPLPYTGGDLANIFPKVFDVEDAYTINNSMVNQIKFGFVRFYQNIHSFTQNTPYSIANAGVNNLPAGQAGQEFPGMSFGTTAKFGTALTTWTGNGNSIATQLTTPNNYTLLDNFQWTKGQHAITVGITAQWQEINNANPATFTGVLTMAFNANDTANFTGSALSTSTTGYSYASFLLGAVGGTPSVGLQPLSEVGGRYFTLAPYIEDTWKVNSKVTVDAGLRWDYLPPYHEVKDRWSFLNPTATNAATGTPGALEFAGNYGGSAASCGCRTPVSTYWQNWGPRVGVTFQSDPKTVWRVGIGHVFSQGGGVGGRGGAFNGTGQLGFNVTATGPAEVTTGAGSFPSFYLNNSAAFTTAGIANTSLFGSGFNYPTAPTLGAASTILNTGNYVNGGGSFVTASSAPGYADPYFAGRAPNFMFYNAGMERALTNSMTLAINYVGNQSHHLINSTNTGTGNARGYWVNQLNPIYLVGLGNQTDTTNKLPLLSAPATAANVAKAQAAMPGINIPAYFQAAAALKSTATIAQGLVAFPQYSGVGDTFANVGNFSYNALQVTVQQRLSKGLTFNFNYTWSRNIGDDGPFRTGFDLPAASISGGTHSWKMNRIDRGLTTVNIPHAVHAYGVWNLPSAHGNYLLRAVTGGWSLSGIYTYAAGTPVQVTYGGCTTPAQGQCMPDVAAGALPNNARINGGYGQGANGAVTACNLGTGTGCKPVQYFSSTAFSAPATVNPSNVTPINLIGNAPRTAPLNLTNPASQNLDSGLRKRIDITERMNVVLEFDALNTWNHVVFGSPSGTWSAGSTSFGTITGTAGTYQPRNFELAGHFNF